MVAEKKSISIFLFYLVFFNFQINIKILYFIWYFILFYLVFLKKTPINCIFQPQYFKINVFYLKNTWIFVKYRTLLSIHRHRLRKEKKKSELSEYENWAKRKWSEEFFFFKKNLILRKKGRLVSRELGGESWRNSNKGSWFKFFNFDIAVIGMGKGI